MSILKIAFSAAGGLIEALGAGMYSHPLAPLKELTQNGYDSDATRIDITITKGKIVFKDNGEGMTIDDIRTKWASLGGKTKRKGREATKRGRPLLGEKGLGRFSVLSIAGKAVITTFKDGEKNVITLKDSFDSGKALSEQPFTVNAGKGKGNGTTVELTELKHNIFQDRIRLKELRQNLARDFPILPDFRIFVNGEECRVEDVPAKRKIKIDHTLPNVGRIKGIVIISKKRLESPGVSTTVRGRAVGKPSFFGMENNKYRYDFKSLVSGRVEVAGFDPVGHKLKKPIIKSDREGFVESHPLYEEYRAYMESIIRRELAIEDKETRSKEQTKAANRIRTILSNVVSRWSRTGNFLPTGSDNKGKLTGSDGDEPVKIERSQGGGGDEDGGSDGSKDREKPKAPSQKPGTLRYKNRDYSFEIQPLGVDEMDCLVAGDKLVINSDHPIMASPDLDFPMLARIVTDAIICREVEFSAQARIEIDRQMRALLKETD